MLPVNSFAFQLSFMWTLLVRDYLSPTLTIKQLAREKLGCLPKSCHHPLYTKGFTLAELLIALAVLGVIATFTIPKILTSTTNNQNRSVLKDTYAAVNAAYYISVLEGTSSGGWYPSISSKIGVVRTCFGDAYTGGCRPGPAPLGSEWWVSSACAFYLVNGATIYVQYNGTDIVIDANAGLGNNSIGDDVLYLFGNPSITYPSACNIAPAKLVVPDPVSPCNWWSFQTVDFALFTSLFK